MRSPTDFIMDELVIHGSAKQRSSMRTWALRETTGDFGESSTASPTGRSKLAQRSMS